CEAWAGHIAIRLQGVASGTSSKYSLAPRWVCFLGIDESPDGNEDSRAQCHGGQGDRFHGTNSIENRMSARTHEHSGERQYLVGIRSDRRGRWGRAYVPMHWFIRKQQLISLINKAHQRNFCWN